MKVCNVCGREYDGLDGDNTCLECLEAMEKPRHAARRKAQRKAREEAYASCGLVKVRGSLGGIYWE
jgi:hypothetical protein